MDHLHRSIDTFLGMGCNHSAKEGHIYGIASKSDSSSGGSSIE
jgi:hypothetical protein